MKYADIVIGANYGDEGKGLLTDYLAGKNPNSSIVCRYNGGAQAGHTVIHGGRRHVFSHFGSGTLRGVPTYLGSMFMVNPVLFMKEYNSLKQIGRTPETYINSSCRVTTPVDMLLNMTIERVRQRNSKHHGSVGVGIFETFNRFNKNSESLDWGQIYWSSEKAIREYIDFLVKEHVPVRLIQEEISEDDPEVKEMYDILKGIAGRWYQDINLMRSRSVLSRQNILDKYDHAIFECAQGLLLSEEYGQAPHLTPSDPGVSSPLQMIGKTVPVTTWYASRAYMSRHGNGSLENETSRESLGIIRPCETNVSNEFQGNFRYAPLHAGKLMIRAQSEQTKVRSHTKSSKMNIVITCVDHLRNPEPVLADVERVCELHNMNDLYTSTGPTADYVKLRKSFADLRGE